VSDRAPHFDWHAEKASTNFAKHGVSFEEAASAFRDPSGVLIVDPDHSSAHEERQLLLGYSQRQRLLVVVHAEIDERTIRIISARRASRQETVDYHARFA